MPGEWRRWLEPGIPFMASRGDYEGSRAAIFGVPMDFTTSFRPGTRHGPQRIRQVSVGIEEYSLHQDRDLREITFCDLGDVAVAYGNVPVTLSRVQAVADGVLADDKLPVVLGGEHLISLPVIGAAQARYPGLAVLHFDAHADLRDDYLGEAHSHATVMRRVADRIGGRNLYQYGIRSGSRDEREYAERHTNFHPYEVLPALERDLPALEGRPVYVSVDIDVLDPAYAPGTGTPEPGGVSSRELLLAVEKLAGLQVVGFDLVEVSPGYDPSERTAVAAAAVIREALLAVVK